MDRVEEGRTRWLAELSVHSAFAARLSDRIAMTMKEAGIQCQVSARAKAVDSLVKKLIRKPDHTFDSLPDKVGARIVVRFRSDLSRVIELVTSTYSVGKVEDKTDAMDDDQMGYLSHHADRCCFKEGDQDAPSFPPDRFVAELQVRTKAQHLWAEMSHDLVYKGARKTRDLDRRVNLMAAQIEVADREFDRLGRELAETPDGRAMVLLDRYYYRLSSRRPDGELTLRVLQRLLPELKLDVDASYLAEGGTLEQFLSSEFDNLSNAYDQVLSLDASGLIHQPEALFLYEQMKTDMLGLARAWNKHFPPKELERLAPFFGVSFD